MTTLNPQTPYFFDSFEAELNAGTLESQNNQVLVTSEGEPVSNTVLTLSDMPSFSDTTLMSALAAYKVGQHFSEDPYFFAEINPKADALVDQDLYVTIYLGSSGSLKPVRLLNRVYFRVLFDSSAFQIRGTTELLSADFNLTLDDSTAGQLDLDFVHVSGGALYQEIPIFSLKLGTVPTYTAPATDTLITSIEVRQLEDLSGSYITSIPAAYQSGGLYYAQLRGKGAPTLGPYNVTSFGTGGAVQLGDLTDLNLTGALSGGTLKYDGTDYVMEPYLDLDQITSTRFKLAHRTAAINADLVVSNAFSFNSTGGNVAIGMTSANRTYGEGNVVIGRSTQTTLGDFNTAVGADNSLPAAGSRNSVLGYNNALSGNDASVMGSENAVGDESVVVGTNNAVAANSVVIGNNNTVSASNAVVINPTTIGMNVTRPGFYIHPNCIQPQGNRVPIYKLYYDQNNNEVYYGI